MKVNLILSALLICPFFAFGQSHVDLSVTVTGIESLRGTIHIAVFSTGQDFPNGSDYLTAKHTPAQSREVELIFSLPPGTYAISVYQDIDGNKEFDQNLFGIPSEPFCFSQNYRPVISAPDFEDCSFLLPPTGRSLRLALLQ